MMLSLNAPTSSLSLSQTSSDIQFGDWKTQLSYAQTSQNADSEMNIQSGILLGSWNKW